jgi:hypothetical protein
MLDLVMLVLDWGIDPSVYSGAEAANEARM